MKQRKCMNCATPFTPDRMGQKTCGPRCAYQSVQVAKDKAFNAVTKKKKKELKEQDRSYWIKFAQRTFNEYIRARDSGLPCISCGVPDGKGKRNACHYRPAGVNTALRFSELNVWGGCERCNTYKSGNIVGYRVGLIARIGIEAVDALDNNHDIKKWTIDELKAIQSHYKSKLKELKNV